MDEVIFVDGDFVIKKIPLTSCHSLRNTNWDAVDEELPAVDVIARAELLVIILQQCQSRRLDRKTVEVSAAQLEEVRSVVPLRTETGSFNS